MTKYNLPVEYSRLSWREKREVREQYIREQEGLCWYCKEPLTEEPPESIMSKYINKRLFPETMFNYPVHLQHDHFSDLTEGAVHARCNAVLWQYEGR